MSLQRIRSIIAPTALRARRYSTTDTNTNTTTTTTTPPPSTWVRKCRYDELLECRPGERLPSEYNAYNFNLKQWVLRFGFIKEKLGPLTRDACTELDLDGDVAVYLKDCLLHPVPLVVQRVLHMLYRMPYLYFYDAQVFVDAPSLFMLSPAQWKQVIPQETLEAIRLESLAGEKYPPVLDVGAGKGDLLAYYCDVLPSKVMCTEVSALLCWKLRRKAAVSHAFQTQEVFGGEGAEIKLVFCLNTLDRCAEPFELLRRIRARVSAGCTVIISLPLPYFHIDFLANSSYSGLRLDGDNTFEGSAEAVAKELLEPCGMRVTKLYRAPYFSSGPTEAPISQVLDTAIFVCEVMF